jgi:hypothetical protein
MTMMKMADIKKVKLANTLPERTTTTGASPAPTTTIPSDMLPLEHRTVSDDGGINLFGVEGGDLLGTRKNAEQRRRKINRNRNRGKETEKTETDEGKSEKDGEPDVIKLRDLPFALTV